MARKPRRTSPKLANGKNVSGIWNRKRDLAYFTFFCLHIVMMLLIDLTPIYPTSIKPQFLTDLRTWYITTYSDQFFTSPPAWFKAYMWMELFYHLPLSVWVIPALLRDDPLVPLHLLVWAVQTAVTTLTCVADYHSWSVSTAVKVSLGQLYLPYLGLAVFMGVDMFGRLQRRISGSSA